MNAEILGWPLDIKWIFAALLVALIVWSVVVIKRAIVGKREGVFHRLSSHFTSVKKGVRI
jgi:hypothetical protein